MLPLYIYNATCISPQQTFGDIHLEPVAQPVQNKLEAVEPAYQGIPAGVLRRMGKASRIGVGAALPLLKEHPVEGIIMGTAEGGMEDCIKFLNQLIDYEEGLLTPGSFVQSTPNAVAAQIGLLTRNKGYNITHVHGGLSFENALLDAAMTCAENPGKQYLLGGLDEISSYNYNIDLLAGWYKPTAFSGDFYGEDTPGSTAGEGAAMFVVGHQPDNAIAAVAGIHHFHTTQLATIEKEIKGFLQKHLDGAEVDLLITGENGDNRFLPYYELAETLLPETAGIVRYKHFSGEYPTSSAIAVWLATQAISKTLPGHFYKRRPAIDRYKNILIYNSYKKTQHGLVLVRLDA